MYYLNKIVWSCLNPVSAGLILMVLGWLAGRKWRLAGKLAAIFAFLWFYFWSIPATSILLCSPLEKEYFETENIASLPEADAIVVLGGGMLKSPRLSYPDMNDAADRVWHAARLWKAGKAPVVVAAGIAELNGAVPLLRDLGVPESAILADNESRNTYENARFTERLLKEQGLAKPKVLLVTSAWHMTRALGNFGQTELVCIPAATDFRSPDVPDGAAFLQLFVPDAGVISANAAFFKEWLGRLARK